MDTGQSAAFSRTRCTWNKKSTPLSGTSMERIRREQALPCRSCISSMRKSARSLVPAERPEPVCERWVRKSPCGSERGAARFGGFSKPLWRSAFSQRRSWPASASSPDAWRRSSSSGARQPLPATQPGSKPFSSARRCSAERRIERCEVHHGNAAADKAGRIPDALRWRVSRFRGPERTAPMRAWQ